MTEITLKCWEKYDKKRIYVNHELLDNEDKLFLEADKNGKVWPVLKTGYASQYSTLFGTGGNNLINYAWNMLQYVEEKLGLTIPDNFTEAFNQFNVNK